MIRVSATWNDQGLSYLKWSGSQLPEMIRVSATWNDQGFSYLKCQLPENIWITANKSDQYLKCPKLSVSQLHGVITVSVSGFWNDQSLSYLKWSGSQLLETIRVSATWNDQSLIYLEWSWPQPPGYQGLGYLKDQGSYLNWSLWPESKLPEMISVPAWEKRKRENRTMEDEKIHRPIVFQLRRVVSIVLQYKLSEVL